MNGQAKVELMLSLKNKMRAGLSQAKKEAANSVNTIQTKLNTLKLNLAKNSRTITQEVPLIGGAFRLLSNPISATAAGIYAIGKGIDYTTQKAADFNTQFRTLANLNLDKTEKEIESLKRMVQNTSFNKGFDINKTITGYFDVQSTTGKYGGEIKQIVEKQGEFANLMQSDFNEYIAGTAKGMANFGFGVDKLDDFNRSAYATVKVGVTTFDQLAKVQSVYAGAAASSNQNFDTANKMLALFTIKTKSVDEAATLTKSMFNDLTKSATIKAFKDVGISLYDANGKIRQADTLMLELNKKFRSLDGDQKIVALKNQFTGSEGLIALIQASTDKSGQLQNTLNSFDSTKLGLNKALEIAKNDVNYINEQLKNKVNVMEIQIGEEMLPIKEWLTRQQLSLTSKAVWAFRGDAGNKKHLFDEGWTKQSEEWSNILQSASTLTKEQYQKKITELNRAITATEKTFWMLAEKVNNTSVPLYILGTKNRQNWREEQNGYILDYNSGQQAFLKKFLEDFTTEWQIKTNFGRSPLPATPPPSTPTVPTPISSPTIDSGIDHITGSARQIRNLTVNIDSFNKGGINTQNTTLQHMQPAQIEEWFTDMCLRIVRSIETTY